MLGCGCFVMFDKSMCDRFIEEFEFENEFRCVLCEEEFDYFLQFVIKFNDDSMLYKEMYICWLYFVYGKIVREQFR